MADYFQICACFSGPGEQASESCDRFDLDGDTDIDLIDWDLFLAFFAGPELDVQPAYKLHGLDFSAYIGTQNPGSGDRASACQVEGRLDIIAPYTNWVRTFGSTNGHQFVCPLADSYGLNLAVGAWINTELLDNAAEIAGLIAMGQTGCVDIAIVGSEVLLRHDVSENDLISYINQVKQALPGIPVTTADVYSVFLEYPRLVEACDLLMVNYYPYWEGIDVQYAVASLHQRHLEMLKAANGKEVIVSETGWPSCGNSVGCAIPSPSNASYYFLNFISWARANNVPYFYFEAFDELWKALDEGPQGKCWGLWDRYTTMNVGISDVFDGATVPDNWTGPILPGGLGIPSIEFTYVPPFGTCGSPADLLRGRVLHVVAADHGIAMYIFVNGGWWTKPTFADPLTNIAIDGCFSSDICTGGVDQIATSIRSYLVPVDYTPPLLNGAAVIPLELEQIAVAWAEVIRSP